MKRWLIRQIVVPWLRERALVLPAQKRRELAQRFKVDEQLIVHIEALIREAIIETLLRSDPSWHTALIRASLFVLVAGDGSLGWWTA
jgi:hypothetical protein